MDLSKSKKIISKIAEVIDVISRDPLAIDDAEVKKMLSGFGNHLILAAYYKNSTMFQLQRSLQWVSNWTIEKQSKTT